MLNYTGFSDGRGWWLKNSEGKESLQKSLKAFEQYLEENAPFDGIIGFSQGAAFLGLVCILLREKCKLSILIQYANLFPSSNHQLAILKWWLVFRGGVFRG